MESLAPMNEHYLTLSPESGVCPCKRQTLLLSHPHPASLKLWADWLSLLLEQE